MSTRAKSSAIFIPAMKGSPWAVFRGKLRKVIEEPRSSLDLDGVEHQGTGWVCSECKRIWPEERDLFSGSGRSRVSEEAMRTVRGSGTPEARGEREKSPVTVWPAREYSATCPSNHIQRICDLVKGSQSTVNGSTINIVLDLGKLLSLISPRLLMESGLVVVPKPSHVVPSPIAISPDATGLEDQQHQSGEAR